MKTPLGSPRRGTSVLFASTAFAWQWLGHATPALGASDTAVRWDPGERTTARLADEPSGNDATSGDDGAYGRFDGLFDVGLSAGTEFNGDGAALAARASVHYFSTAGVYAGYVDSLGGTFVSSARVVSLGVDLRPAFIPRWSKSMEGSSALLDLTLDSISLGLGAFVRQPKEAPLGNRGGFELSFGFGVPLAAWAAGPWIGIRGIARWDDPWGAHAATAEASGLVILGWHFTVGK